MTIIDGENVKIDWTAPFAQGSPITQYSVYVRKSDELTYSQPLGNCDSYLAELVTNTECSVSKDVLRAAPFSLDWGDALFAYVVATNVYGDSADSPAGNGAILITYPDAPVNLLEDLS